MLYPAFRQKEHFYGTKESFLGHLMYNNIEGASTPLPLLIGFVSKYVGWSTLTMKEKVCGTKEGNE